MSALVGYLLLFVVVGFGFIFVHLLAGKVVRPAKPVAEKLTIYECGEPTVGSAWVQFDLRYYVIALLFVIFDVEVAFFFPWAVVFGQANSLAAIRSDGDQQLVSDRTVLAREELLSAGQRPDREGRVPLAALSAEQLQRIQDTGRTVGWLALADILVFFGVLLVGFAYLWKRGDLAWVKSTMAEASAAPAVESPETTYVKMQDGALVGAGRR
jgi:NADH-quinone oxidoreductase subunit A